MIIAGERFGALTAVRFADRAGRGRKSRWEFVCDCGRAHLAVASDVKRGGTRSCGCLRLKAHITHGATRTPEYWTWRRIIDRCENPKCERYASYGGRGITICPAWRLDFEAFLKHVGPRPSPKHSIDRIDNDRGYEPGNVRWADDATQRRNKSTNIFASVNGERLIIADACRITGIRPAKAYGRISRGVHPDKAVMP